MRSECALGNRSTFLKSHSFSALALLIVLIGCVPAFCQVDYSTATLRGTVLDPQGQTIHHALSGLGYGAITDVRQGKFFVLNLDGWSRDEAQQQLEKISKEVLTNPVIEEYRFEIVD